MLIIIHGSDVAASRKFFLDEKNRADGASLLREDEINLTHLAQLFEGGGLFESSKSIFIEEFLTRRQKSAERESILLYLQNQAQKHIVTLWEGKELTLASLIFFKSATIKVFKLSSTLFAFLDAVKPKNSQQLLQLFHQSLATTEEEMIFFMLVRQFRILLCLSEKSADNISEVARLAPWQKGKLEKQVKIFDKEKLRELYSKLFAIEIAQKTGGLSTSLIPTIDFFLIEI